MNVTFLLFKKDNEQIVNEATTIRHNIDDFVMEENRFLEKVIGTCLLGVTQWYQITVTSECTFFTEIY